jgi:hypothetical protein
MIKKSGVFWKAQMIWKQWVPIIRRVQSAPIKNREEKKDGNPEGLLIFDGSEK